MLSPPDSASKPYLSHDHSGIGYKGIYVSYFTGCGNFIPPPRPLNAAGVSFDDTSHFDRGILPRYLFLCQSHLPCESIGSQGCSNADLHQSRTRLRHPVISLPFWGLCCGFDCLISERNLRIADPREGFIRDCLAAGALFYSICD